jgi:hypothetical protein
VHIATLWPINGDDAASGGGEDTTTSLAAQMDASNNFAAGLALYLMTEATTDAAPTLGPLQDKNSATDPVATLGPVEDRNSAIDPLGPVEQNNSAWNDNLAGTSGAGRLTTYFGPTALGDAGAGSASGNVLPASSDNSFQFGALGVGTLDGLMSAASAFGAGGVLTGAGIGSGGNDFTSAGVGFFAAATGSFSPPAGQPPAIAPDSFNLDGQLSQLVQAMATFSAAGAGVGPSPITQGSNDSALLGAIAVSAHM